MDNRYNRHNRRKYSLKVHIVLVMKYRRQFLKESVSDDVKKKIFNIANVKGYQIIAIETDKDHIHFLKFKVVLRSFPFPPPKQKALETVVFSLAYCCIVGLRRLSKSVYIIQL